MKGSGIQADPFSFQLGVRLTCPSPMILPLMQEQVHIKRLLSLEHEINGSGQFLGQNSQGFGFAVFTHPAIVNLPGRIVPLEE